MGFEKISEQEMLEMVREISDMVNVHFIRQKQPRGLGHAILCAKTFLGEELFVVLLGDDEVDKFGFLEATVNMLLKRRVKSWIY